MAKYTWEFDQKYEMSIREISEKLRKLKKFKQDGITISGGDPFDQTNGLLNVLKICHELNFSEILVYSGYDFSLLKRKYDDILKYIDILISGPFIESLPTNKIWRGSDNQEILLISERSMKKYRNRDLVNESSKKKDSIQFDLSDNTIFIIGIPRRGDLSRLENQLRKKRVKI